jgi:hypothetical protein
MARTKEERHQAIHSEAMAEFDNIQSALRDERLQCLQDRRFYSIAGAQWEGPLGDQFENKPRFEVNKIHLSVIRIINEYRNNRITVDFVSKDGTENDRMAETCDGLYRADEQDSGAEEAYDNAFEEAVGGGYGAWRLRACYENEEDPEDERQRIRIEPIFDADSSVFFDLGAKRQDKADAKRCFVLTSMTPEAYREEWGDDPASWPKEIQQTEFDWLTPDVVYIAEYYRVVEVRETLHIYRDLSGEETSIRADDLDADEIDRLAAIGSREVRTRSYKCRKVHKYILSGGKVLEDCGIIAGKCIPIVPMYGKRWFVDNVERCMGHVRLAKDAQRLKNMQLSKLGELSALSSTEKPILLPEQVAGHQVMWSQDNLKNYPYLLVNPITDANGQPTIAGPIGYTRPPMIPPAMAALLQITETDMQDLLGNQQAGEQLMPNMSGRAVELVQGRLDMQVFIYMSNMAKAVKRSGEIWLSMAKEILVEDGRKMKAINAQGKTSSVELRKPVIGSSGVKEYENDFESANFDISVEVGPSSSSKRSATVKAITGMMTITQDPETLQVLGAMAMMNMEGEGISEVKDYFRKRLLSMGVVKPTDEEAAALAEQQANTKEDPQALYLQAAAQQATAAAAKANSETVLNVAKTEKTQAETAKVISDIDAGEQAQALEVIDRIQAAQPEPAPVTVVAIDKPNFP